MLEKRYRIGSATARRLLVPILLFIACGSADGAGGDLLWEDRFNFERDDGTWAVAAAHGRVVVVGQSDTGPGNIDVLVRAYDGATGALLWQDRFDYAGGLDVAQSVVVDKHVAVVAGSVESTPASCLGVGFCGGIVRAYHVATGALLWQDLFPTGGVGSVEALALHGNRVIATGYGGVGCDFFFVGCDLIARAYDARTGAVLWEDQFDGAGDFDQSASVAATGNVIVIGGSASTPASPAFLVRAYEATSGDLLWQDQVSAPVPVNSAHQVAARGGRVFAVGLVNRAWLVRAYHARTGRLLWEQTYRLLDNADARGVAWQVAADGQRVVVGGMGAPPGPPSFRSRDWVVNAYDAATGERLWSDVLDVAGDFDEVVGGLAIHRGQVFAYGVVTTPLTSLDMFIRAYDVNSGQVLWQDQIDQSGLPDFPGGFYYRALAADQGRVTVGGWGLIPRPDGTADLDWIVRTYDASNPHHGDDHEDPDDAVVDPSMTER